MNIKNLTYKILNQVKILDYLRTYYGVDFKLHGKTYQASCPIGNHDTKTPSFSIPINEEYFKCFGSCGAKGNVINFVEQYHNYDREEAILKICNDVGISIEDEKIDKEYNDFISKNKKLCIEYSTNLIKVNKEAYEYLTVTRGLTLDTIKEFKLGATVDEWMKEYSNRITFPIESNYCSDILAYGYGYVDDKDSYNAKYINSKSSDYFKKSELFYGYNQAITSIRKEKRVYLVEGYFDVLSLHQSGIKNVMGIMCSSISDEQIETLKRIKCEVVLLLDNDEAGIKGIRKAIPKFIENNIKIKVISLPGINDADELCVKNNFQYEKIKFILNNGNKDPILFFISDDIEIYNNTIIGLKSCIINKIMPIIQLLPEMEKDVYKDYIYNLLKN